MARFAVWVGDGAVMETILSFSDYLIIFAYLAIMTASGFLFRRFSSSAKEYFIGGNQMSWVLAGMSSFMMSFSAFTFTGAAGFAYKHGFLACVLYLGNAISLFFAALFIAKKVRQSRCTTYLQIVRQRYGRGAEQLMTWIKIPMYMFAGATWIIGFSIFASLSFGVPLEVTVLVAGAVIIMYSTLGGSWAVVASDSYQSIVLVVLVTVISILTLFEIGGVGGLYREIEPERLLGFDENITVSWMVAMFVVTFFNYTSVATTTRFLSVRDGRSARKVAFLAGGLFLIGSALWFVPPIAAAHFFPHMAEVAPHLNNPEEAAYLAMAFHVLPAGLIGLLVMVVFGATLSTMDSSLNQSSSFFTINFYQAVVRKNASSKELHIVGQIANCTFGLLVVSLALVIAQGTRYNLFDLTVLLQSIVLTPMALSIFLIYFFRRTPRWAGLVVVLSALFTSFYLHLPHLLPEGYETLASPAFSWMPEAFLAGEEVGFLVRVCGTVSAGLLAFGISGLFWGRTAPATVAELEAFYRTMDTPVEEAEVSGSRGDLQMEYTGFLLCALGSVLLLTVFLPDVWSERPWINAIVALSVLAVGLMYIASNRRKIGRRERQLEMPEALAKSEEELSLPTR